MRLFLTVSCLMVAGCVSHPEFLETKYLSQKSITVNQEECGTVITVSGLCGHSALGVGAALMAEENNVLRVELPLRQGFPGNGH